ncbi:hypothetical protein PUMCH_003332 [Australozyma saopauloensis]|uniref:Ribophorin II C-terminal domain-containing protein n=1 Tax=Australozyma saopauloensis TaxID=291208 RepID=A0AAX4HBT7_9ASCO|nr:hypothetical protein PUMCH_003332 [[Candida] saopauloensis]
MKFTLSAAVAGLAAVASANAYKVIGGSVTSKKVEIAALGAATDLPSIPIDSIRDSFVLNVNFEQTTKPAQLLFLLSNKHGLEHSLYARFTETGSKASASVVVGKLPNALKTQDEIHVSIVAAGPSEEEENVIVPLCTFIPSEKFKDSVEYEQPVRLGALPEIHHQFRSNEPHINSFVPTVFSAAALGLLVVLLGAWAGLLNGDMFSGWQGSFWKIGYLATLAYFELIVLRYYLGTSIFATVFQGLLVAGPLSFFGSRALTALARLRK